MSIPFENPIPQKIVNPIPDEFKGWYVQEAKKGSSNPVIANGANYGFDVTLINYKNMAAFASLVTTITIPEEGVWFINYNVSMYAPGPALPQLKLSRDGVDQGILNQGYGNNSGAPVYMQTRNTGYFYLEEGDVLTLKNGLTGNCNYRIDNENNFWSGQLVAKTSP